MVAGEPSEKLMRATEDLLPNLLLLLFPVLFLLLLLLLREPPPPLTPSPGGGGGVAGSLLLLLLLREPPPPPLTPSPGGGGGVASLVPRPFLRTREEFEIRGRRKAPGKVWQISLVPRPRPSTSFVRESREGLGPRIE